MNIYFSTLSLIFFKALIYGSELYNNHSTVVIVEGDIKEIKRINIRTSAGKQEAAVRQTNQLWAKGEIPYWISPSFSPVEKNFILYAMQEFRFFTCIKFVEWKSGEHHNFVSFIPAIDPITFIPLDDSCFSEVGFKSAGNQTVDLGKNCFDRNTILHELMHLIGFYHEHSRPDRNDFITIIENNIIPGKLHNFKNNSFDDVVVYSDAPYDFASVTHYKKDAFAKPGGLITIKPVDPKNEIKADGLSATDIKEINYRYECIDTTRNKVGNNYASSIKAHSAKKIERLSHIVDKAKDLVRKSKNNSYPTNTHELRKWMEEQYGSRWIVAIYKSAKGSKNSFVADGGFENGTNHTFTIAPFTMGFIAEIKSGLRSRKPNCDYWKRVLEINGQRLNNDEPLTYLVQESYLSMKLFVDDHGQESDGSVFCGEKGSDYWISSSSQYFCNIHFSLERGEIICSIYAH